MKRIFALAALLIGVVPSVALAQTNDRLRFGPVPGLQVRSVAPAGPSVEERLARLEDIAGRQVVVFDQTEQTATSFWNDASFNQALNDQRAEQFCETQLGDRYGRQVRYTRVGSSQGSTYFRRVLCETRPYQPQ